MLIYRCLSSLELKKLLYGYDNTHNDIGFSFSKNKQVSINWLKQIVDFKHVSDKFTLDNYIITLDTSFLSRKPIEVIYTILWFYKHPEVFMHVFSMTMDDFNENKEVEDFESYVECFEAEEEVIIQNDNYNMVDGLLVAIETNDKELLVSAENTYSNMYSSSCKFKLINI
jgi:hypothetical protein